MSDGAERKRLAAEKMRAWRATPDGKESVRRQNEKRKAKIAAWHAEHPERMREIKRASALRCRTPEIVAFHNHRARSRRLGLPALGVTPDEWLEIMEIFGGRCAYCNEPTTGRDHIEPLSRGGLDVAENVVPACIHCNSRKYNKTLLEFVVSGGGLCA